jgi:hypothetical protein
MPSNINNAWKNDLFPLIQKSFDYNYESFPNMIKQIMSEEDSKTIDYRIAGGGGYGELPAYDGANLIQLNQKRGFVTIIYPQERGAAIDLQIRYKNTDKSGNAKKIGKQAALSTAMTVYLAQLRLFGNAWNPAKLGGDGQPWASHVHPVASLGDSNGLSVIDPASGTFDNFVNGKLSVQAITAAQTMANRYLTPDGLPFMCDMSSNGVLLVSPELEPKAKELCGDNGRLMPEHLPESNENGSNPIYGLKYVVVGGGNDGFGASQWAIADKNLLPDMAKTVFVERPNVLETDLDNPLIARYVPYVDFGTGFAESRCIIFSDGSK